MLNRDFARTSRDIGRVNMVIDQPHIKEQEDWGKVMSKFLTDYKNQQNEEALTSALQSGDEEAINKAAAAYDPQGWLNSLQKIKTAREDADLAFQRQKELAAINNAAALERTKMVRSGGANGGFGNTEAGLALGIASGTVEATPEMQQWAYNKLAGNSAQGAYDIAYNKKKGAKTAEQEVAQLQQQQMAQDQNQAIDNLIGDIEANEELVGVYSPIRAKLGRFTGGKIGYNDEQLETRGNLIRQVGNIQNEIIAKARAAGQTGINTIAEIKQATKGLDEDSSSKELIGALRAMQKSNDALTKRMSQTPVDPRVQQALDAGYSMDEINAFLGR
jgi:hypothetical protein